MRMGRFELSTPCMSSKYSNQLSYTLIWNVPKHDCLYIIIHNGRTCKQNFKDSANFPGGSPKKIKAGAGLRPAPEISFYTDYMKIGAKTRAIMVISLIRMLIEGPEVSLKGSPTVSPLTAAA